MANTPKRFYKGFLPTEAELLYEVTSGKKVLLKNVVFTNTTASNQEGSLYILKEGETITDEHKVIANCIVPKNDTVVVDFALVLEEGDMIYARQKNAYGITSYISGLEVE